MSNKNMTDTHHGNMSSSIHFSQGETNKAFLASMAKCLSSHHRGTLIQNMINAKIWENAKYKPVISCMLRVAVFLFHDHKESFWFRRTSWVPHFFQNSAAAGVILWWISHLCDWKNRVRESHTVSVNKINTAREMTVLLLLLLLLFLHLFVLLRFR